MTAFFLVEKVLNYISTNSYIHIITTAPIEQFYLELKF